MTQEEFRKELNVLLNKAAKTVNAEGMMFPLIDACAGIVVLASSINRSPLEGMVEILRHRLDNAVVDAKVHYAAT